NQQLLSIADVSTHLRCGRSTGSCDVGEDTRRVLSAIRRYRLQGALDQRTRMTPMSAIYPFLAVRDVDAAVDFYVKAFGAIEERERMRAPDGPQVAVLSIAGHRFGVATEAPDLGTPSPETVGATTVRISLDVDDPDALAEQAVAAGAY